MIEGALIFLTRLLAGASAHSYGFSFEPATQRIYYANHSSHMDTLLLWSLIPKAQRKNVHPVAARDYWWSSSFKRYIAEKIFRAVPVSRGRAAHEDPLHDLEAMLDQGGSLIFFPEGTRGSGTAIQPFKNGLYHLARKHPAVELVPVYIDNLNRVLPKGEFLPVPVICMVRFGAPFTLMPDENREDFIMRAHSNLSKLAVL